MSIEDNKAIIRMLCDQVWNNGKVAVVDEYFAQDVVDHDTVTLPGESTHDAGREGMKNSAQAYRTAFPDLHFTVEDQIGEADCVVTHWTARGTLSGPLGRFPATGKRAVIKGVFIDRLAGGRIVEEWSYFDMLSLLGQVGLIPSAPPSSPESSHS